MLLLLLLAAAVGATTPLPPTDLAYDIEARVDPAGRALQGTVNVTWRSTATHDLDEVPVHLYLNAFAHLASTWTWSSSALRDFDLEGMSETWDDPWGGTTLTRVTQDGRPCEVRFIQPDDGNALDRSLAMVTLAEPVAPGQNLVLTLAFEANLPVPIARTGCHPGRGYCHVAQWFPKLGWYDAAGRFGDEGFVAQQFHGPTEFFAPFADYRVQIDAPASHDLVATGRQVDARLEGDRQLTTWSQRAVHDFAFALGRDLVIDTRPHQPEGGGPEVAITVVTQPETAHHVDELHAITRLSLDVLSSRVGPYPWDTMTVIEPPLAAAQTAGMEYQTLVTGIPGDTLLDLPGVREIRIGHSTVAHEVAHNWFQGLIATNEVQDAFLDEGFTSYWEQRILAAWDEAHGPRTVFGLTFDDVSNDRSAAGSRFEGVSQPQLTRPSWLLAPRTTGAQLYSRPPLMLHTAAARYGTAAVDALFQAWYRRWAFGHPRAEDFVALVNEETDGELRAFLLEALHQPGFPDYAVDRAESKRWKSPLGHVPHEGELVMVTPDNRETHTEDGVGLDPIALEEEGVVAVVRDPGRLRGDRLESGREQHLALSLVSGEPGPGSSRYYASEVRVTGPAWDHLPVVVRFGFDDDVVVEDLWDGRTPWRTYRFVRKGRLDWVRLDPEATLHLEGPVSNNAERLSGDTEAAGPWAAWVARIDQWMLATAGWWL